MLKHDVFLSFRGKDTHLNFLDHLYAALIRRRISTFRDDKHLEKGISISKQLVKAIEGSKVSVVIVSPNYASSEWCLNELLKILESRKISKVGNKNGTLMRAFTQQEEKARNLESYKINKWKASLQNKENNSKHNKRLFIDLQFYGNLVIIYIYICFANSSVLTILTITSKFLLITAFLPVRASRNHCRMLVKGTFVSWPFYFVIFV